MDGQPVGPVGPETTASETVIASDDGAVADQVRTDADPAMTN